MWAYMDLGTGKKVANEHPSFAHQNAAICSYTGETTGLQGKSWTCFNKQWWIVG